MVIRGTLTCHHVIIKTVVYVELELSEGNTGPRACYRVEMLTNMLCLNPRLGCGKVMYYEYTLLCYPVLFLITQRTAQSLCTTYLEQSSRQPDAPALSSFQSGFIFSFYHCLL